MKIISCSNDENDSMLIDTAICLLTLILSISLISRLTLNLALPVILLFYSPTRIPISYISGIFSDVLSLESAVIAASSISLTSDKSGEEYRNDPMVRIQQFYLILSPLHTPYCNLTTGILRQYATKLCWRNQSLSGELFPAT